MLLPQVPRILAQHPAGPKLTEKELGYCVALIELYLKERLPKLKDEPEKVPLRRKAQPEGEGARP